MRKSRVQEDIDNLRHSAAHLLAAAVVDLYPMAKPTIGPTIENGFYYDFDFQGVKVSEDDLDKIEKKMKEIVKNWKSFERIKVDEKQAKTKFKDNLYKLELIKEFSKEKAPITFYKSGEFVDLCRGGHVDDPQKKLRFIKLMSIAGAYWRGSEKNPMLTRIYGTSFFTQKELDNYLSLLEEAKKRDHKKIGKELELFMF